MKIIDPHDPTYHQIPLWCVYGEDCFPQLLCAKLDHQTGPVVVWGYSIYRGKPGFRTLGVSLLEWSAGSSLGPFWFLEQEAALQFLGELTTPSEPLAWHAGKETEIRKNAALVAERVGCDDSSCLFVKPKGMATNGGCRCADRPMVMQALARLYKSVELFFRC